MIRNLTERLKAYISYIIPFYNLKPTIFVSDIHRDKDDLVNDLARKRLLINQLNKRFEISILAGVLILLVFGSYIVFQNANRPQNRVFNTYMSELGVRLNNISNKSDDELIREAEIVIALSMINEGDFNDAALFLSGIKSENAEWLKALCFIRIENNIAAKTALQKILKSKGKYSKNAKELLNNYYQQ